MKRSFRRRRITVPLRKKLAILLILLASVATLMLALLGPYLGQPGLKVFAVENVQPPRNPVAAAFARMSGQTAYQVLVLLMLCGAAMMMMTPFLDRNGQFSVTKAPSTRFGEVLG